MTFYNHRNANTCCIIQYKCEPILNLIDLFTKYTRLKNVQSFLNLSIDLESINLDVRKLRILDRKQKDTKILKCMIKIEKINTEK